MKKIILLAFTFLISTKGFGDQVNCETDLNIQNLECNIENLKIMARSKDRIFLTWRMKIVLRI